MESVRDNNTERIRQQCAEKGLLLHDLQLRQLEEYADLLESKNKTLNLVSRKEKAPLLIRHIFHSLLIGLYHRFKPGEKVLDIGTGGGLPGIPLAIAFPETSFLLIDATGKKINACREMIQRIGLKNVHAKKERAEELKGVAFHTVLSRQVAPLRNLCRYAEKLLLPGGSLICLKGGYLEKEIEEALDRAKKNNGFPADVSLLPIDHFDACFENKYIVIANS
ncbi:16S rRNA (guanine(527)-N(7))-methyltransferase RsmG [Prosthecochloris sp.]|uniref:16S rRNA (guanine(527)-N(7))-methyltransferase RsmG n=1 Tax=Prosthecochloris sp. TaxID=290513 RepID=UPI0025803907|nr:16S rRNA (guanine(527)-N(7))-methyltransferase RsmG [Prosthecochloris sp.]